MEDNHKYFQEDEISLPICNAFVVNQYKDNLEFDYLSVIKNVLKNLSDTVKCPKAEKFEFSIKLSTDDEVHSLNKEYRGKDSTTNVLSFEYDLEEDDLQEEFVYIGDIIFAIPVVEKQAKEQNKTLENHFAHLVAHSVLHLFGFDHINQNEQEEMEKLEIEILKKLKINNPYIIQEDN